MTFRSFYPIHYGGLPISATAESSHTSQSRRPLRSHTPSFHRPLLRSPIAVPFRVRVPSSLRRRHGLPLSLRHPVRVRYFGLLLLSPFSFADLNPKLLTFILVTSIAAQHPTVSGEAAHILFIY
ncbi:hypothetical protein RIF29_15652 [Crotalaria pallida]|uniref:Uncharacterized protein n=1 Tax=Crotalaria pallida TaxID=3830 RepID=A0AAN9IJ98_CROPI